MPNKNPFQSVSFAPTKPVTTGGVRPATKVGTFAPTPAPKQGIDFNKLSVSPSLGIKAASPESNLTSKTTTLKPAEQAPVQKASAESLAVQNGMTTPSGIPITGNAGTWSGGQTTNSAAPQSSPIGVYPQLIQSLSARAQSSPEYTQAFQQAQGYNKQLQQSMSNEANALRDNYLQPIPIGDQEGRARAIRDQYLAQQQALGAGFQGASNLLGAANTQQQLQQQALTGAAQFAQPQLSGYGQTFYNPLEASTGISGGQFNPNSQAQQYAQEVANGTRTYDDAVAAMGLYGNAGKQFLDQAIRQVSPNFNFAQSQSLATTQGLVGPQYNFATQALSNVENALNELGGLQKTSLPIWNQFANWASLQTGLGDQEATRRFVGAVQTLRNAYAQILATAKGGTPTDYSAQANAEIPDVPTPNDLAAIRHNLETLGQARIGIFGQPGGSQVSYAQPTGNSIYDF